MPKIVCAEDDKLISTSLVEGFTAAGFEVTAAHDGEEAVTKIKEIMPDVVLLDIMMPETASIPVIMLTNLSDSDTLSKILEAGVTDYLLKSEQTIDQIIVKVNEVLSR